MMKRNLLVVAFHFPPLRGSSGIQRTLRFCRYLPEFGWTPVVLSAHPRAYDETSDDQLKDIPPGVEVIRAFALNAARHLAIGGRHPRILTLPDRWATWWLGGVVSGLRAIRRHNFSAIYSTYPIATAHLIALTLHRLTGLKWVADFRDPMAQEGYPEDPATWRAYKWIEERTVQNASRTLFTSPSAVTDYRRRYPDLPEGRFSLLENGFDEDSFADVSPHRSTASAERRPLVFLHSGIVYASERDPTQLFEALGILKRTGVINRERVLFRFRASANDAMLTDLARRHGVSDLVSIDPPIGYREALREMLSADTLLIMQAANCNSQIPAKAYEYLRAGRPILALTDSRGDTADLMRRAGLDAIVQLDSVDQLTARLPEYIRAVERGAAASVAPAFALTCSRRQRTSELANVLGAL